MSRLIIEIIILIGLILLALTQYLMFSVFINLILTPVCIKLYLDTRKMGPLYEKLSAVTEDRDGRKNEVIRLRRVLNDYK